MTVIKKITAKGFKSFASKTEIPFSGGFNMIIGANGAGKCVSGDTLIQMADGSLTEVGKLVEEKLKKSRYRQIDDGFIIDGDSTKVLSLDTTSLKITPRPVLAYVKRKAPENLIDIRTRSGRRIRATEYHPLFMLDNGQIRSVNADELKEGIRVAVPRNIPVTPTTKLFIELLDLINPEDNIYVPFHNQFKDVLYQIKGKQEWRTLSEKLNVPIYVFKGIKEKQAVNFAFLVRILKACYKDRDIIKMIPYIQSMNRNDILYKFPWENSLEFARFLGYLLAEGRLPLTSGQIWFTNGTEEIVSDYKHLADSLFGVNATINEYKHGCYDVLVYSTQIQRILTKFGMPIGTTKDKNVTSLFLSHSSNLEIAELLNGLYCGDGYVSKNSVEITTKSKNLAVAIENMLSRLGISSISRFVVKIATNSGFCGVYKSIYIYGVNNLRMFNHHIKLVHDKKQKKLESLLTKKSNPNLDLIDVNIFVKDITHKMGINIKANKEDFPRLDSYYYNQCLPSVNGVKYLINNLFSNVSLEKSMAPDSLLFLRALADSDIYWDEIVEIQKIKPEQKWVYDLTIEKDHNFIANNFFVHNSNVCDALCFVLGKSSAKGLRAERSANLIYNGGKKKNPAKEAEVSVVFDNSRKRFPIATKDVELTRIVRHSGQSVYKINNETRTRQQVLELLSAARIDPDGHNIVLQGDIIGFTEMRPDEKRELIEEIAGISVYEDKKQKAIVELENVSKRLGEAKIILAEREAYLRELKKDRDQALKYKELEESIRANKATYIHLQIKDKELKKQELEAGIAKQKSERDRLTDKINELNESLIKLKDEVKQINIDIEEKGEKEQVKLHKDIEDLKTESIRLSSRKDVCASELEKIKQRKVQLNEDLDSIGLQIDGNAKKKQAIEKEIQKLESDEKTIADKISRLKEKYGVNTNINAKIEDIDKKIDELQSGFLKLHESRQAIINDRDRLEIYVKSLDDKISSIGLLQKDNAEKVGRLKQHKEEFKHVATELSKCLNDDSEFSSKLSETRHKLVGATEELARLKAREINVQERVSGDIATKRVLQMKDGIFGTVASLGKVSSKYSLALEVAAGSRIKSIVVKDDAVAAKAIKMLKDNKLGIATFLPLNKIKGPGINPEMHRLKSSQGVIGAAIDLVKFDNQFKDVFSYVFNNTLVVDNIQTARKLGIGRARMVTLDGDVADLSGAMVGGYRRVRYAAFNENEVGAEITRLEKDISKLKGDVMQLESAKAGNEGNILKLKEKKAVLEVRIVSLEGSIGKDTDIGMLTKERDSCIKQLDKASSEINNSVSDGNELKARLEGLKSSKDSLKQGSPKIADELSQLDEEKQKTAMRLIELRSELRNININVNDMLVVEKNKILGILKSQEKEREGFEKELSSLASGIIGKGKLLKEMESKEKRFYSEFKELFNRRNKINDSISKAENNAAREEDRIKYVDQRTNTISLERAKVAAELEGLNKEFEDFAGAKIRRNINMDELKYEVKKDEGMLKNMGNVNMRALEIYENVNKEYEIILEKAEKLKSERDDVLLLMNEIDSKKQSMFMKTFNQIHNNFKKIFSTLSSKGEAYLELENTENVFEGVMDIKVRITGNKYLDLKSLSGGEKTLTALAFIFAIQEYSPTSFYFLDEVDAALDKRNSQILSALIKKYSAMAQFIVVSHNDHVISDAEQIYGVSMQEGVTKVTSLKI